MEKVSPQGKKPEEKKIDPPWPIEFNRQSLLAICNGSGKGADLLYCLLNKARWEIHNQKLEQSVKTVKFHFDKADILKALAKAGKTISQGSYSANLQRFKNAGYITSEPYTPTFEIHLDVLKDAFANPPQPSESVKVSKRQTDTIGRKEYDDLMCQFVILTEKVSILTQLCQSLTQNTSFNAACENCLHSTAASQSNDYKSNKENLSDCVDTSSLVFALDPLCEDLPEAQPILVFPQQANNSYSQNSQATEQTTLFPEAHGYEKNEPPQELSSKSGKIELTSEQAEQCRRWYTHFEKVRGEPFETKGDKINARKYIKMLVLKYDETTIMRIYKHLSEKDFKWSKPSFRFKITPYVVYDEAPSVLQQFTNPEQVASNQPQKSKISPTSTPEVQQQWQETLNRSLANTDQRLAEYLARKQAQQVAN